MPVTSYSDWVVMVLNKRRIAAELAWPFLLALQIHDTGLGPVEWYERDGETTEQEARKMRDEAYLAARVRRVTNRG